MGIAKISKPLGYTHTVNYPRESQNAYYYTENGTVAIEFHGKLAENWDLIGKGEMVHFDRLAAGKHPHSEEQLIKHRLPPAAPWLKNDSAWREHLESMLFEKADNPRELLRTVPPSEHRRNGPTPERPEATFVPEKLTERQEKLVEMHAIAAGVFRGNLAADVGAAGREYLDGRKVSQESREKFGLGYSVSGDQLREKLSGFDPELMEASGLFWKDKQGVLHDRFRDRVMFPIHNRSGQVVAFAARLIDGREDSKYINSRETEIYKKSEVLYNFHRADAAATGRVVVQEGYLDVIAADQAGVHDVVGLSGKNISAVQAQAIRSIASDVVQNLDGGPEELTKGQKSQADQLTTLMDAGLRVRSLNMPDDPDTFIQKNGAKAYRGELENAKPLVEWLAEHARAVHGLNKPEVYPGESGYKHVDAIKMVMAQLAQIPEEQREQISAELRNHLRVKVEEEATTKKTAEHVASWDIAVAPHKSYSATALVGGDKRIVEWHNKAVRDMLDAGEKYTQARMGKARLPLTTGSWVVATFLHDTSRPVGNRPPDPQLHTHCVIMNMTDANGNVVALLTWELFRVQSYMNAVYEASLAAQARAGGYELEHGKNFSTRIKGYSDEYLDSISARTTEIEAEKEKRGVQGAAADEIINKQLRQAKGEWDPGALREQHRQDAIALGQNPAEVYHLAAQRITHAISPTERHQLAHQAIAHARDRLFEHQAVNDHYEIMRDALRFGLGHLRLQDVEQAFGERQEFVRVGHYRENAPGARYTTKAMREMERASIEIMLSGKGKTTPIAPSLTQDEFRERFKYFEVNGERKEMGNGQLWLGFRVLTEPHQFMIIRGAAGTGKTKALEPIAEIAEDVALFHKSTGYEVIGLALPSKVANNLRTLGIESYTLQAHNLAPVDPTNKKRLYIMDEGSLVGTRQFYRFLKSVRPEDRVVIAYDPRQHQAVEAGRIIEEMEQAGVTTFKLEKIVRQRNNPELLEVVNLWKEGQITEGLKKLDDMAHVKQIPDRKQRFQVMAEWYASHPDTLMIAPDNRSIAELNAAARVELRKLEKLGPDVYEAMILVGSRDVREADRKLAVHYEPGNVVRWGKGVAMLHVQSGDYTPVLRIDSAKNHVTIAVNGGEVTYNPRNAYGVEIYTAEKRRLAVGERIQITRPWRINKDFRVANRAMAAITKLDSKGHAELELEDGKRVKWDARQNPHIDYAYAMTSYSLQYATSQNALLHIDTGDSRIRSLVDSSLVYVGGSRPEMTLHVFTDNREALLGLNSPVNRQQIKPKALSNEEISERSGYAVAV